MGTQAVEFDYDDVLPTVRRAHPHASRAHAEDAIQIAAEEHLKNGVPLTAANIIQRARSRLLTAMARDARTLSLDAFEESDEDSAPVEMAIEEVDFDSHVELAEARENPILRRRLEAAEQGVAPMIRARGNATHTTRHPIEVVNEARRLYRCKAHSIEAIARELGVGATTVLSWCRGTSRHLETAGWSQELIVEAFQAFAREEGRRPTALDVKRDKRLPALSVLYRYFATIDEALRQAGLPSWEHREWNRDRVLDALSDFKERRGHWPRHADIKDRSTGLPGCSTIERHFGFSSLARLARLAEARHAEGGPARSART